MVTDGLALHLDAANPASYPGTGTTWTDLSGNNNNGTLVNGVGYDNTNGGSLVFDGTNDHVNIQDSSSLVFTNNFTVQVVCSSNYPDSNNWRSPMMHTTDGSWMDGYGFYQYNGNFSFFVNTYNGAHIVNVSKTAFPMTHWIATYNGQNLAIYENGVLRDTGSPYSTNIITPSSNLRVGSSTWTGGVSRYWWNGNIAQSSIYNRALTTQEIQQNYNALQLQYGL